MLAELGSRRRGSKWGGAGQQPDRMTLVGRRGVMAEGSKVNANTQRSGKESNNPSSATTQIGVLCRSLQELLFWIAVLQRRDNLVRTWAEGRYTFKPTI